MLSLGNVGFVSRASSSEPSLLQIQKILAAKRFVDLTHAFAPGIPHWHGFPDERREEPIACARLLRLQAGQGGQRMAVPASRRDA